MVRKTHSKKSIRYEKRVPAIRKGDGDFLFAATELTHHVRKFPHRVSGKIGRGFSFKIHPEFSRYRHGKVVYLMDERILELSSRR